MAVAFRDYYETLGVPRDASAEDIRRAYRKLARRFHPDVNKEQDADDRFKEISEAYEVLRDPEKRDRYDRFGQHWKAGQDVSGAGGFEEAFRRRGGRAAGGDFGDVHVEFGGGDFSDFFEGMFGGRARGRRAGGGFDRFSMRGNDVEAVLELSLEEAAAGGKKRLSLDDGREFEVDIPKGVRDGQRIRLAGEGGPGMGEGPAGDLYLRVRLKKHPRFRVRDRNLEVDVPVAPWEAALGASVPVPTLNGTARVSVPPGSSSGRKLRLRGEGLGGGDLLAVVKIVVPKELTKDERELFERLAKVSKFDPRKGR